MRKEAILNIMTKSPEGEELTYCLTEHISIYIVAIVYRDEKWYLNIWNDYQDNTVIDIKLEECDAIEYITYDYKKTTQITKTNEFIENIFKHMEETKSYYKDYIK